MNTSEPIVFAAEVKRTASRKSQSNDMVYQTVLETWQPAIMQLSMLPANVLVKVTVEVQGDADRSTN